MIAVGDRIHGWWNDRKVIEQGCEFYGHERSAKTKATAHSAKVGKLRGKAKALRFQPGSMMGALETPSRVKMNAKDGRP